MRRRGEWDYMRRRGGMGLDDDEERRDEDHWKLDK